MVHRFLKAYNQEDISEYWFGKCLFFFHTGFHHVAQLASNSPSLASQLLNYSYAQSQSACHQKSKNSNWISSKLKIFFQSSSKVFSACGTKGRSWRDAHCLKTSHVRFVSYKVLGLTQPFTSCSHPLQHQVANLQDAPRTEYCSIARLHKNRNEDSSPYFTLKLTCVWLLFYQFKKSEFLMAKCLHQEIVGFTILAGEISNWTL